MSSLLAEVVGKWHLAEPKGNTTDTSPFPESYGSLEDACANAPNANGSKATTVVGHGRKPPSGVLESDHPL